MQEIGFWDYTCPGNGSLERYTRADWDLLLDDMAAGGMNSFVLCVKWITTGYRSALPWLDQDPLVTAITSDNALIHHALRGARARGMRTHLLVVGTIFPVAAFGMEPTHPLARWGDYGHFDPDLPGVTERILQLFAEVATLFGAEVDGIIAELECSDGAGPHRIPLYDAWAKAEGRRSFAEITQIPLEPRSYPFLEWRDFTTERRVVLLRQVADTLRHCGFTGAVETLTEVASCAGVMVGNVNLERLRVGLPEWELVTYDSIYDRRINRLASMDFCIVQPQALGFHVSYLTRGVMTFGANWSEISDSLDDQWRMSLEDALAFRPQRLWFMGADARLDGMVCSDVKLPQWGYPDGRTARLALMKMAREMAVRPAGG